MKSLTQVPAITLLSLLAINPALAWADSSWQALLARAQADMSCPSKGCLGATWHNDLVLLRRAWMKLPSSKTCEDKEHKQVREAITLLFRKMQFKSLETWYSKASCAEIDRLMRSNYKQGKTMYRKDWRVMLKSDRTIHIRRLDNSFSRTFAPTQPEYFDFLDIIGPIPVNQEVPAAFDVSAVFGMMP